MKKRKKILIIGLNFYPENVGIGKYTSELALELCKNSYDIRVICSNPYYPHWKVKKNYYSFKSLNKFLKVFRCPIWVPKKINGLSRVFHLLSFFITSFPVILYQYFWKPNILITTVPSFFTTQSSLALAALLNKKTLKLVHYQDLEIDAAFKLNFIKSKLLINFMYRLEKATLSKFDYVSSISEGMINQLKNKSIKNEKIYYLPNWVDTSKIFPLSKKYINPFKKELNIPEDKIIFMYSGSMNKKQGIEILIELALHKFKNSNIFWVFGGEGSSKRILEEKLLNSENVRLCSLQPEERMNDWLNLADIHLIPQKIEATDLVLPSKLITILASGKPFICTAPKFSEIFKIAQKTGLTVEPGNFDSFKESIELISKDDKLRIQLGQNARKLALKNYDKKIILSKFCKDLINFSS